MTSPTSRVGAAVHPPSQALGSAARARWLVQALASAAAASALLAGCSTSSHNAIDVTPPGASASPAPTTTSVSSSAESAILAQYRGFWRQLPIASRAAAASRQTMLAPYAADPELRSLLSGFATGDKRGEVFYGEDVPHAHLTQFSESRGVAVVDDCQDSSHAGNAKKANGQRLTVGVARNHVVATMHRGQARMWRVVFVSYSKTPC